MFKKKKKTRCGPGFFFIELPLDPLFPSRYHARTRAHTRTLTLTIARGGFCVVNNSASLCATHTHTYIRTHTSLCNSRKILGSRSDFCQIIAISFYIFLHQFYRFIFFNPMMRFKSMWGEKNPKSNVFVNHIFIRTAAFLIIGQKNRIPCRIYFYIRRARGRRRRRPRARKF